VIDTFGAAAAVFGAGIAAGTINTIVGSGTLITFPTLLALGVPPVLANTSNTLGLVPGSASGAWGYRRELVGQRQRFLWLAPATITGGILGAILLLVLPSGAFKAIVPVLIALGVLLVIIGPSLSRRLHTHEGRNRWLWPAMFANGIYGGYFGAAQGVIMMALFTVGIKDDLQRLNALKNVLSAMVNGVAAVVFLFASHIDWRIAGLLAVGSLIGGQIGASVGRRLPPVLLRAVIVCVGVAAIVSFTR
jgi:uncharacterized membrane protein YfcA